MKLETIYKELQEMNTPNGIDFMKYLKLMEKLEEKVREETCFKTTNKTRVSAIKKVASKLNSNPALQGYGILGDFKVVTDSYHLIAIKEENMPLPLVATKEKLQELGIDLNDYRNKNGRNSILCYNYPNVSRLLEFNKDTEIELDFNDIASFYKLNHSLKEKEKQLYKINECLYNINYLKNIIDTLGTDTKCYFQGINMPLYFENENGEIGLVLPVKIY